MMKMSALAAVAVVVASPIAVAQSQKPMEKPASTDGAGSGNTMQPQGETGQINTGSGGAPAESPQGETPPGMQAAPQGSDKTIPTDSSGKPDGTPRH